VADWALVLSPGALARDLTRALLDGGAARVHLAGSSHAGGQRVDPVRLDTSDPDAVLDHARRNEHDLVVAGPDVPEAVIERLRRVGHLRVASTDDAVASALRPLRCGRCCAAAGAGRSCARRRAPSRARGRRPRRSPRAG
jgi:hypothetical protein